jgi:hypothetical protein
MLDPIVKLEPASTQDAFVRHHCPANSRDPNCGNAFEPDIPELLYTLSPKRGRRTVVELLKIIPRRQAE